MISMSIFVLDPVKCCSGFTSQTRSLSKHTKEKRQELLAYGIGTKLVQSWFSSQTLRKVML